MRVAGSHLVQALVVICFYFLYGAGSVCLLDARRASGLILGMKMKMILVEITHIVVMEINFVVILLVLIILLFKSFILVVWSRAQCWSILLHEMRFTHLILVNGWGSASNQRGGVPVQVQIQSRLNLLGGK